MIYKAGQKVQLSNSLDHGAFRGKAVILVRNIHYSVWVVYCSEFPESKFVDLSK